MGTFDAIAEAFVRLRPKADDDFEVDGVRQISASVGRIADNAARVFAAAKIFQFGKEGLEELKDAEATAAQTAAAIKATGGAAGVTAEQVGDLAESLSDLSGKDDEAIQKGENLILTFRNVRNEAGEGANIFDRTTAAALDLSIAGFGSIESASLQLGKALNDPIAGMTALSRSGVTFSQSQKDTIKSLVESGQMLEAQKVILAEVEAQVGGAAKAYGETLPGKLERAQTAMDNAKGALVSGLAPALEIGAELATQFAEAFQDQPEILQQIEGGLLLVGGGVGALLQPVADLAQLFTALRTARAAAAAAETAENATTLLSVANLAKLGVVLGTVAAATVAATAVYQAWTDEVDVNVDVTKAAAASTEELMEAIRLGDTVFGGGGSDTLIEKLTKGGEQGIGILARLRAEVAANHGDTTRYDEALKNARVSLENTGTTASAAKTYLSIYATEEDRAKAAADNLTESLDKQRSKLDEVRQGYDNALTAQQGLIDSSLGAAGADIARRDALDRIAEAQDKINKATTHEEQLAAEKDLERATLDYERAINGQAQAQADLEIQTREAGGTFLTESEKTKIYLDKLEGLTAEAQGPAKEALETLRAKITEVSGNYQAQLQYTMSVNGYVLTPTEIQGLIDAHLGISLNELRKQEQKDRGDYATGGLRASGGPIWPGEWIVGEEGPERMRINADGTGMVWDATATASMGKTKQGEIHHHTWNIYEATTPRRTALEVVQAMDAEAFLTAGTG